MAGVEDWSVVASSNTASPPTGAPEGMAPSTVNDTMRQMMANVRKEWAFNSLTATATMSIGSLGYGYATVITDANKSISSFDTIAAGVERELVFGVAATLVHDATKMILPGAANITVAAGDVVRFRSEGSGNWRAVGYVPAATAPVAATQTEQEAGSSNARFVTPGRQQFHQSAMKFWGKCGVAGDLASPSYNIASVTDRGAGQVDVALTTAFSSGNYCVNAALLDATSTRLSHVDGTIGMAVGGFTVSSMRGDTGGLEDPSVGYLFSGSGDQ